MNTENMKNMVVLKNLPSNIVDEANVILKPNIKLKSIDLAENKKAGSKKIKSENTDNPKKYIINEAEMVISSYLAKIEKEKKSSLKVNKKIEYKYKRLKAISVFLGVLLFVSFLIK